jgi:hypothetical protein
MARRTTAGRTATCAPRVGHRKDGERTTVHSL